MELQILVVALLVQTRSGGNMAALLDNLSATIHKRLRLQERVRALTGEGRMQAAVLIVLPIVVGAGGTGLGLTICREIITLHQGTIRAEPTHGCGACLRIVLPRCTPDTNDEMPSSESQPRLHLAACGETR